jgi:hypothetical protein
MLERTGRCHFEQRTRGPCGGPVRQVVTMVTQGPLWDRLGRGKMKRVAVRLCNAHELAVHTEGLCPAGCVGWCLGEPDIVVRLLEELA